MWETICHECGGGARGPRLSVVSRWNETVGLNKHAALGDPEGVQGVRTDPEGGAGGPRPLESYKLFNICFPRKTGKDPPREAIGPLRSNCFSREVRTALCEIR